MFVVDCCWSITVQNVENSCIFVVALTLETKAGSKQLTRQFNSSNSVSFKPTAVVENVFKVHALL